MPSIVGQRALRQIMRLPFCYLCSLDLDRREVSSDHVPPKSCLARHDRPHEPLVLPTHLPCNTARSYDDERLGQFLSMLHTRGKGVARNLLKFEAAGSDKTALTSVNLYGAVERWIRAFHAALYSQPLDAATRFAIELTCNVMVPTAHGVALDSGRPRQRALCEDIIRRNRDAKAIDRLSAWNGRLCYECTWEVTAIHAYCVFWLDFYDWHRLAAISQIPPRECVGFYEVPLGELPPQATRATSIATAGSGLRFGL